MYTGDERGIPAEHVQAGYTIPIDPSEGGDHPVDLFGRGRGKNTVGKPVYRNPDVSEQPEFESDSPDIVYSSWDDEPEEYEEGAFMTWSDRSSEFEIEVSGSVFDILDGKKVATDGGQKQGMPYGGSSTTVEFVSESDDYMGDFPM
jgi:hypothetical protein